jgi:hypothetical protein
MFLNFFLFKRTSISIFEDYILICELMFIIITHRWVQHSYDCFKHIQWIHNKYGCEIVTYNLQKSYKHWIYKVLHSVISMTNYQNCSLDDEWRWNVGVYVAKTIVDTIMTYMVTLNFNLNILSCRLGGGHKVHFQ